MMIGLSYENSSDDCPDRQNFSPCHCQKTDFKFSAMCIEVPLATVTRIFKQIRAVDFDSFYFGLSPSDENKTIPADFIGNHTRIRHVILQCNPKSESLSLDPQAFRSSKNYTERLYLEGCNMSRTNFKNILNAFNAKKLMEIGFSQSSNVDLINWTSITPLTNMTALYFAGSHGLTGWKNFPNLTKGLEKLELQNNFLHDEAMDRILNWTLKFSANTLESLFIQGNGLTKIPWQISKFKKISVLAFEDQREKGIPIIFNGSKALFFHGQPKICAKRNKIIEIQPGALQGFNYSILFGHISQR